MACLVTEAACDSITLCTHPSIPMYICQVGKGCCSSINRHYIRDFIEEISPVAMQDDLDIGYICFFIAFSGLWVYID